MQEKTPGLMLRKIDPEADGEAERYPDPPNTPVIDEITALLQRIAWLEQRVAQLEAQRVISQPPQPYGGYFCSCGQFVPYGTSHFHYQPQWQYGLNNTSDTANSTVSIHA
jgi:hypothetical protein